jgi:hypothetical protein
MDVEMNVETNLDTYVGATERGPTRRYDPIIGTLVAITDDHEPVVEFDAPDGEPRRRTAFSTVRIEDGAVGHSVELMFVRGDLDRPVITKVATTLDWQAELQVRWDALGRRVQGIEPWPHEMEKLALEARVLACVAAWFAAEGNITHAASKLRTSRRALRQYVKLWKEQNPRLVPRRPAKERKHGRRRSRANVRKSAVERPVPVTDGSVERDDGSTVDG